MSNFKTNPEYSALQVQMLAMNPSNKATVTEGGEDLFSYHISGDTYTTRASIEKELINRGILESDVEEYLEGLQNAAMYPCVEEEMNNINAAVAEPVPAPVYYITLSAAHKYNHGCTDHAVFSFTDVNGMAFCERVTNCTSCWQTGHDNDHEYYEGGQMVPVTELLDDPDFVESTHPDHDFSFIEEYVATCYAKFEEELRRYEGGF